MDKLEKAMRAVAREEVEYILRHHGINPHEHKVVEFRGANTVLTIDELVDRRLTRDGDRIRQTAVAMPGAWWRGLR